MRIATAHMYVRNFNILMQKGNVKKDVPMAIIMAQMATVLMVAQIHI